MDALLADLKAACQRTAARKPGFEWKGHECLYKGVAMREQSDDLSKDPVPLHPPGPAGPAGTADQYGFKEAPEQDGGAADRDRLA